MRYWIIILNILFLFLTNSSKAAICKKEFQVSIKMSDEWQKNEEIRLIKENNLVEQYSNYISKVEKPLKVGDYCSNKSDCDEIRNCQMEKNIKDFKEIEYLIKLDSGIIISKSYCSVIGKCIGYNDFFHDKKITASENRLIDVRQDNAIFYHYFYSADSKGYEPLFNMTNFHTGYELYFNDIPHFSPDDKFIIEVKSVPKREDLSEDFPAGYDINIYESNEYGEYKNIEPAEFDEQDKNKVISTFLSRNPECGKTPYFRSWKNNREAKLYNLPSEENPEGKKVILFYNKNAKKWQCRNDDSFSNDCIVYLPDSVEYISNMAPEQLNNCR